MLSAARPGIRASTFDPLLIDNFNRPNGSLGTAYNGQVWTGTATINSGRFTAGNADIAMTGAVGNFAVQVDCDPGSSALGDQAYMSVLFFKDPSTSEKYYFEISQRNWYLIYFDASNNQTILTNNSPGYAYSTPFRLYITAQYLGGVVYYQIETSNLTGGAHTVLTKGSYWNQVTNGSHLQLNCSANQFFDNLRLTTTTLPSVSLGGVTAGNSLFYNFGTPNMLVNYTVSTFQGSTGTQHWGVSQLRTQSNNFTYGWRYQWSDSSDATDYMTREDNGQSVISNTGITAGLGTYSFYINGTSLNLVKKPGSGGSPIGYSNNVSDVNIDSNTYFGIAPSRDTIINITGMPL